MAVLGQGVGIFPESFTINSDKKKSKTYQMQTQASFEYGQEHNIHKMYKKVSDN